MLLLAAAVHASDAPFVHPGLLHTEADFQRMRDNVQAGRSPWIEGYEALRTSRHASLDWRPRPLETVVRGGGRGQNYAVLFNDMAAAYAHGLQWKITGDKRHADKAVEILDAWSATLKRITGSTDASLAAGLYGYQLAIAAEIMRDYDGWPAERLERFQRMMLDVFYPANRRFLDHHNGTYITHYWANWDLCNMASIMAIGVLCDRRDLYDEAIDYFHFGAGNGSIHNAVWYVHPGHLGQQQESGRDQGHATLCISLMAAICEMAWHQGDDLYGYDNNRVLAGAEYVARYNLLEDVPYVPYIAGTGHDGRRQARLEISPAGRGNLRAGWEMIYNHYVNRRGIAAPWTTKSAAKIRPEGGPGGHSSTFDQPGFGTLTFTRDPIPSQTRPTGLTATLSGDAVVLSWWGAAGAVSYTVKRAARDDGRYEPIATIAAGDDLTFTDRAVEAGVTHRYIVTARFESGEATDSDAAAVAVGPQLHAQLDLAEPPAVLRYATPRGWQTTRRWADHASKVNLPSSLIGDLSDFTIAAWVHLDGEQKWARIFDFGSGIVRYMFLTPRSGDGAARFAITLTGHNGEQRIDAPAPLPTGRWVHVAVTLHGSLGTIYVDGEPVGRNDAMFISPMRLGPTTQNWIGRSQYEDDPPLDGQVHSVRIYHGAMAPQHIASLMTTTRPGSERR